MHNGPKIASVAALIGDPARANMLTALLSGRALTVSELAGAAGIGLPTASAHLARLTEAGLLSAARQGRHRYLRLAGPDVAAVLEGLMGIAQRTGATPMRNGPRDPALREARICYDHLAGIHAVRMMRELVARGWITAGEPDVTSVGRHGLACLGIDVAPLERSRRPLCRCCLDWSERESHLAGGLGAALLDFILERRWARRADGRVLLFSPLGKQAVARIFHAG